MEKINPTVSVNKKKHFIIIIPGCDFRQYTRRFHYEALAKLAEVTIIPFPISLHKWLFNSNSLRHLDYKENNLNVVRCTIGLPRILYLKYSFFLKLQNYLLRRLILKHLRKDSIVVLTNGDMGPFWSIIASNLTILELTDAPWLLETSSLKNRVQRLIEFSDVLLNTNVVFCSSINLTQFAKHLNKNVFYVPNTTKVPLNIKYKVPKNKIVFGFIGNINEWIDLDLIEKMSKELSNKEIVFVGDINGSDEFYKRFNTFIKDGLVQYFPRVSIEHIVDKIQEFDVGIIPYALTFFNSYVYPNKLIQYLSCGKPVITTCFSPDLQFLKEYIHIAYNDEEFILYANKFIQGELKIDITLFEKLRLIGMKNSADERAKLRLKYLEDYVAKQRN